MPDTLVATLVDGVRFVDLLGPSVHLAELAPSGFALRCCLIVFLPFMGLIVLVLIRAGCQLLGAALGCLPGFLLGIMVLLVLFFKTDAARLKLRVRER